MKKIIVILISFLLASPVFAERVILKSGKSVEGEVIERTDKYIKINFAGIPLTYYSDEIERIEGAAAENAAAETEGNYANEKYGVAIKSPRGWHMQVIERKTEATEILVIFSKHPLNLKISPNPNINLVVTDISTLSITDPREYMERSYKYLLPNTVIDILPLPVKINGIDGAMAAYIRHSNTGAQKVWQYCFIRDKSAFNISMVTRQDIFSEHEKDFNDSLNTFRFLTQ